MKQLRLIAVLLPLVIFSPLAIDIFLPALPIMASDFNVSTTQMQWTITVFIFSLGIGQLFLGPISDRIGRRPIALLGVVLYAISALLMVFEDNFELHLILRFFQGLGSCAIIVSVFASVTDRFDTKESSQIFSYLNGMIFCIPAVAPILGYFLTVSYGWQSNFVFMTEFAAIFGVVAFKCFKETYIPRKKVTKASAYKSIITNSSFVFYATVVMLSMASITAFVSTAPNVFIHQFHLSEETFTHWFSLNAGLNIVISLLTPKLIEHFKINSIIKVGMGMVVTSGVLLTSFQHSMTVINYMLPVMFGFMGFSLLMGTCAGKALSGFKANAGSAAALLGFIQMSLSALLVTLVQALHFSSTEQLVIFSLCFVPLFIIKQLRDLEKEPEQI
ncbi:Bcr/CflA family drug resistance efflux transporter [Shewanella sp. OPT22]|nr:Bcr/CflA family drug resistance efflux transporter [Shewanella sp. OPT22]